MKPLRRYAPVVAGMRRNRWPEWTGLGGRNRLERVAEITGIRTCHCWRGLGPIFKIIRRQLGDVAEGNSQQHLLVCGRCFSGLDTEFGIWAKTKSTSGG
jgi:hypothetical protein